MINPNWLRTFRTLVEVGHFTKTAATLHMTQPGVSQHIKKLEEACRHELLQRQGKSFELTIEGEKVYQYSLSIEREERSFLSSLDFDDPFSGDCRLACSGSLALKIYPHLVQLQLEHPKLRIKLEAAPNRKIFNDIDLAQIDLGIVTQAPDDKQYESDIIGEESLHLVLPSKYQALELSPDLLMQCGLLDHPDAKHYLSMYLEGDRRFEGLDVQRLQSIGYVNQLSQILIPIQQGLGFTVLPYSAIEKFADKNQAFVVSSLEPVFETLFITHKKNRQLPKRFETVTQLLTKIVKA
jgi:DNA-binding transcriptional LysR family regulator